MRQRWPLTCEIAGKATRRRYSHRANKAWRSLSQAGVVSLALGEAAATVR
jgi:hypothetical protein